MTATARRGSSHSPWFGRALGRTNRTSRELMPTSSWWVGAPDFYGEARRQLPRLVEADGPLVSSTKPAPKETAA